MFAVLGYPNGTLLSKTVLVLAVPNTVASIFERGEKRIKLACFSMEHYGKMDEECLCLFRALFLLVREEEKATIEHLQPAKGLLTASKDHRTASKGHLTASKVHLTAAKHLPSAAKGLPSAAKGLPSAAKHLPSAANGRISTARHQMIVVMFEERIFRFEKKYFVQLFAPVLLEEVKT